MKSAKIKITDIKNKDDLYIIGVEVQAEGFTFPKAIAVRPIQGDISVEAFKKELKDVIIKEIQHRRAIEPIRRLQEESFVIEYEKPKS
jgi:hypothetical protein